MGDQEAAAAKIAAARIGDRLCVADRHRGVERVAAAAQDVGADCGRARFCGDDHAMLRLDRGRRRGECRGRHERGERVRDQRTTHSRTFTDKADARNAAG